MQLQIDLSELKKRRVFVATPMYGGACTGQYTKSTADLARLAGKYELDIEFFYLFNESLITRARNYCVDEFLRNERFTHLMFIDSDIGFDPNDVLALAAIADPDSDKDIICGPYPKKTIAWEKIKRAVDRGFADENPNELSNFVGDFVFNPISGQNEIRIDEPVEVMEGGTGFMMIRRDAFEKFAAAYPHFSYKPDHVRSKHFDGTREIMMFFQAFIDDKNTSVHSELTSFLEKNQSASHEDILEFIRNSKIGADGNEYSNRYLSEDYMFCQWARKIGLKVWLCPWMNLIHVGTYMFGGSLPHLAKIGASGTADPREKLR